MISADELNVIDFISYYYINIVLLSTIIVVVNTK